MKVDSRSLAPQPTHTLVAGNDPSILVRKPRSEEMANISSQSWLAEPVRERAAKTLPGNL